MQGCVTAVGVLREALYGCNSKFLPGAGTVNLLFLTWILIPGKREISDQKSNSQIRAPKAIGSSTGTVDRSELGK